MVGVGRYVRERGRPATAPRRPSPSPTTGRGRASGSALTQVLAGRAVEEGISAFTALLLADNDRMSALLGEVGRVEVVEREGDSVAVDVPIDAGVADDPGLRSVLRAVAVEPTALARAPGARPGE